MIEDPPVEAFSSFSFSSTFLGGVAILNSSLGNSLGVEFLTSTAVAILNSSLGYSNFFGDIASFGNSSFLWLG